MATDDFFYIDVVGERNLLRNLDQMPDTVRAILVDKVTSWTSKLEEMVRDNIETRLKRKTGKLEEGLQSEVTDTEKAVEGRVFIRGVKYAAAQERGATMPPHLIYPRNGKVLAFIGSTGDKVFATRVIHPGGRIPASRFMKDAYREMGPEISRGIKTAVVEGIRAKMRSNS